VNLPEALDAALRDRYGIPEVKSAATTRRGLTARMNQLEKAFSQRGDRKGAAARRAAEAAGISPRTWQKWRAGSQHPGARLLRRLEGAYARHVQLPKARAKVNGTPVPSLVRVTAVIKWSSSPRKQYNAQPYRSTTLEGMRGVMIRVIRAWQAAGPDAAAEVFQRGAAEVYGVPDDDDGTPGIEFQGDEVEIDL
jgi:transcriptional regulator with XRE-family HTH domain